MSICKSSFEKGERTTCVFRVAAKQTVNFIVFRVEISVEIKQNFTQKKGEKKVYVFNVVSLVCLELGDVNRVGFQSINVQKKEFLLTDGV